MTASPLIWEPLPDERAAAALFDRMPGGNLLQSPAYGAALAQTSRFRPARYALKLGDRLAGYVQICETKALGGLLHGVTLDLGPLWADGFGNAIHLKQFFDEFARRYPHRMGRRRRVLPGTADGPAMRALLEQTGLRRTEHEGYKTLFIDLRQDEEQWENALKPSWRQNLNRARAMLEDGRIEMEWESGGTLWPWMRKRYELDISSRAYPGPAPQLLDHLAALLPQEGSIFIGRVKMNGSPVAGVAIFRHGQNATYLAGWNGEDGRKCFAHHLLLRSALPILKTAGISRFDLGGIDEKTAAGVTKFKNGMGGSLFEAAPLYK